MATRLAVLARQGALAKSRSAAVRCGRGFATDAAAAPAPAPAPAPASSSTPASSGRPEAKFTGASANDAYAGVAHAGFEAGSEGRFGYSPKYAAAWERVFGKKEKVAAAEPSTHSSQDTAAGFARALEREALLPGELKASLLKLDSSQRKALFKALQACQDRG
mmetsp:Transcript_40410/g.73083  ORF Transcript_40410/g.73083 Transcript_40410/m.73083 type:complete len:163 (-) Transcript_40410:83-571(-)